MTRSVHQRCQKQVGRERIAFVDKKMLFIR